MSLTQLFLAELDREAARTRRVLERVPHGRDEWAPHPRSMPLGRLAGLVASMPSWVTLVIDQDELDLTPPPGQSRFQQPSTSNSWRRSTVWSRRRAKRFPAHPTTSS